MRCIGFFVAIFGFINPSLRAQDEVVNIGSQIATCVPTVVHMGKVDSTIVLQVKPLLHKVPGTFDKNKQTVDNIAKYRVNGNHDHTAVSGRKPLIDMGFAANFTSGTPADNSMAISDKGILVSVVNSNVRFYTDEGVLLGLKTLAAIAREAGNFSASAYDPHVVFDNEAQRFIMIFLSGYGSSNTSLVIGFSQGDDPTGDWNFYRLPGNVHGNNTWSDYPFIGVNTHDVFVPVLLWRNGESGWDNEAEEIIWQIDKQKGYDGKELQYKYYDKIGSGNRLIWNTRPVWGSTGPYGPNMYFLANRAIDIQNDTFFLFEITNSLSSGQASLKLTEVVANEPYGIPPSALQPRPGDSLRTNYADIHAAMLHEGRIHFVANSRSWATNRAGIYVGTLSGVHEYDFEIDGFIYSVDSLDLNYPSMAYAGAGGIDRWFAVSCLHSDRHTNPGFGAFYTWGPGQVSGYEVIKAGLGPINVLDQRNQERWGDYTGAQRQYGEPGVTWCAGSFANANGGMDTWVARLVNDNPYFGIPQGMESGNRISLWPNPSMTCAAVQLRITQPGEYEILVQTLQGQVVETWPAQFFQAGSYQFALRTEYLRPGQYTVALRSGLGVVSQCFIKQ
ncbi:MAG: hypothetical protein HYZ16_01695 [Bacteroidetes bacterium]|jgi:hypothetical protein|nr:hypothetical protein [Bacteroidota bacterium]